MGLTRETVLCDQLQSLLGPVCEKSFKGTRKTIKRHDPYERAPFAVARKQQLVMDVNTICSDNPVYFFVNLLILDQVQPHNENIGVAIPPWCMILAQLA